MKKTGQITQCCIRKKGHKELITCTQHVFAWMGSEYSGLRWDKTLSHLRALSISLVV